MMHATATKTNANRESTQAEAMPATTTDPSALRQVPLWSQRMLPLQASLKINALGDKYEQEAERIAEQVMRMPAPQVQRKSCACGSAAGAGGECAACKQKKLGIQRMDSGATSQSTAPPIVHQVLQQPGRPLDRATRNFMEARFGQDFSKVRVHTDQQAIRSAEVVNALAYTVGQNVVFSQNRYAPHTLSGRQLIAHELSHVVQQNSQSLLSPKLAIQRVDNLHAVLQRQSATVQANTEGEGVVTESVENPPDFGTRLPEPACPRPPTGLGRLLPDPPCPHSDDEIPPIQGEKIKFCTDSDIFKDEGERSKLINLARRSPAVATFKVHGYASMEGNQTYNQNLACHRAKRAARELINAGVPSQQIQIEGKGPTRRFDRRQLEPNRIVQVDVQAPIPQIPLTGVLPANREEIVELAKSKILRGEYRLAADAYLSFWSCGTAPNFREAIRRTTIRIDDNWRGSDEMRLGFDHPVGLNTVLLSPDIFQAENPLECVIARIMDLAFHHMVRPIIVDHAAQHHAALFAVELAGFAPCKDRDTELLPGIIERGRPWWRRPTRDPRHGLRPTCADLPLPGPLSPQQQTGRVRQIPSFSVGTFEQDELRGPTAWLLNRRGNLARMAVPEGRNAFRLAATVIAAGDPAEFTNYEIGFIQTLIQDDTTIHYVSGHTVSPSVPVPIRDGRPTGRGGQPPWFEPVLGGVTTPDPATGVARVELRDAPAQNMAYEYVDLAQTVFFARGRFRQRAPEQRDNVMNRAVRHLVFNTWLVARRVDAPLDRFSTHFLLGRIIDFQQNVDVVGESGSGTYSASMHNAAAGDQTSIQMAGPVPSDLHPAQRTTFTNPPPRAQAGGVSLNEFRARIRQVARELDPLRQVLGLTGQLMIRVRVNPETGRLQITSAERPTVTVEELGQPRVSAQGRQQYAHELLIRLRKDLILAPMSSRDAAQVPIPVVLRPLPLPRPLQTEENPFAPAHGLGLLGSIHEEAELERSATQLRDQPSTYDPSFWPQVEVRMGEEQYCYNFTVSGLNIDSVCVDPTMRTQGCVRPFSADTFTLRSDPVYRIQQLGGETFNSPIALTVTTFPIRFVLFTPREHPGGETFNHEMHHMIDSYELVQALKERMARRIRARLMAARRAAAENPHLKEQLLALTTIIELVEQESAPFHRFFQQQFLVLGERLHAREDQEGHLPPYRVPASWADFRRIEPRSGERGSFTAQPCH